MKLSISNIAWAPSQDEKVYFLLKKYGFTGLEIAPARVFPEAPYEKLTEAASWAEKIRQDYGLSVSSIQSIWYGRAEMLFGPEREMETLLEYTKKAIDFAGAIACGNLVFGCPRNRNLPEGADANAAIPFFREIGDYAAEHGAAVALEANPPIYHTNYINDTPSAFRLIEEVGSPGFLLNLDVGTMIWNGESPWLLIGRGNLIHHVHISEPGLVPIKRHKLHKELTEVLKAENYKGFVSIEMQLQEDLKVIEDAMAYVAELAGY